MSALGDATRRDEVHLVLLWSAAVSEKSRVLDDLHSRFEVLAAPEVRWSRDRFSANLSRFYGEKLPPGSNKEATCGAGPFVAVIVRDGEPQYAERPTPRGTAVVNTSLFDAKARYRSWTGGGHRVHATNSVREADHDLALLFGVDTSDFDDGAPELLLANEPIERDLVGTGSWRDAAELFRCLNSALDYVVLRNFEGLPDACLLDGHGDVDLLVADFSEAMWVANARACCKEPHRVQVSVDVAGNPVRFDLRHVGDGYYDESWQRQILEQRELEPAGFYRPAPEDHFYSLLYHGIVHKPALSTDYRMRLSGLTREIGIDAVDERTLVDAESSMELLDRYMERHGYRYVRPDDLSVPYRELRSCPLPDIAGDARLLSSRVLAERDGVQLWSRVFERTDAIVKQTVGTLAADEADVLSALAIEQVPAVREVRREEDWSSVVMEKVEGRHPSVVASELRVDRDRLYGFFESALILLCLLRDKGVQHRDIRDENVLVRDWLPVLIDFGWAVRGGARGFTPPALGGSGRPPDGGLCDVYSMGRLLTDVKGKAYPELDSVLSLMTQASASLRITEPDVLLELVRHVRAKGDAVTERDHVLAALLTQISRRDRRLKRLALDAWSERTEAAAAVLIDLVPRRGRLILVDDNQWGEAIPEHHPIPFLERDGDYWGPPPDDETAIAELERLRCKGAEAIAFAWPSFWWLDHYRRFAAYLEARYAKLLENDDLVIYRLDRATHGASADAGQKSNV